jgi:hypothetical protein
MWGAAPYRALTDKLKLCNVAEDGTLPLKNDVAARGFRRRDSPWPRFPYASMFGNWDK